ncbi:hypothetical protein VT06_06935 [Arsukibacterium sp. MJ3]|jgi:DNA-binding NtrC family response regulator|uniref:response regulator n=1 Tax=Arsukibacterium sp. MJ3 TaxID=1632859 RepID=UPI00062716F3|nr:response regulator [Arsukibacterium sp. MJ3]KKO49250.1 hypothetical protein VT06_06935 [Arsukibacterium sp. MJ3]
MLNLLFIDDDAFVLSAYQRMLHREAHHCHFLQWPEQVWSEPELANMHMIFVDQQMPGINGTDLLWQLQQRYPLIKRVLISANVNLALRQKHPELLLDAILTKPCSKLILMNCIKELNGDSQ